MGNQPDDLTAPQTDDGETVGVADVQADIDRASGDRGSEPDREGFLEEGAAQESTDGGVAVGAADAEEDRRRASGHDDH